MSRRGSDPWWYVIMFLVVCAIFGILYAIASGYQLGK